MAAANKALIVGAIWVKLEHLNIVDGNDVDVVSHFGRAAIGYMVTTDEASFAGLVPRLVPSLVGGGGSASTQRGRRMPL